MQCPVCLAGIYKQSEKVLCIFCIGSFIYNLIERDNLIRLYGNSVIIKKKDNIVSRNIHGDLEHVDKHFCKAAKA